MTAKEAWVLLGSGGRVKSPTSSITTGNKTIKRDVFEGSNVPCIMDGDTVVSKMIQGTLKEVQDWEQV